MTQTYKILFIDNSASDKRVYRRFLEALKNYNFIFDETGTVHDGLEKCKTFNPDCILMEYRLPDVDGVTALPEIQSLTEAPVIFITSQVEPLVQSEAYRYGAFKFISKDLLNSFSLQSSVMEALGLVGEG